MDLEQEIQQIKNTNNALVIEKAKAEERLLALEEQKLKLEADCKALGIKPDELLAKKQEVENELLKKISEAKVLLGLEKPCDTAKDTVKSNEAPSNSDIPDGNGIFEDDLYSEDPF